ncbi:MAG: vitamin B12-dependent ribonucleotide reductase [Deltaproteobacteria bacterium]|nr:vitamin B12-dependent ribonucleotide reductase [Deltaproteobacteria bacterium]
MLSASPQGVRVPRKQTREGLDPLSEDAGIKWEQRSAGIADANGKVLFKQDDLEVPVSWSQTATNIVANKYFRGTVGTPEREKSVRQLVLRVVDTLTSWGRRRRYFAQEADAAAFHAELSHLLVTQKVAFNSPVWFNVGVEATPQCSACFINSVDDTMESILGLAKTEGMLFKFGSGAGSNLSPIRSSRELLAGGGTASGPVSFMRGFDAFAGVIKSGGKTRRAAKMVILNVDHPDILEFVESKSHEEKKAWALIEQGYDGGFNVPGGAYDSVFFQNANHSVRVTDTFMKAVAEGKTYFTKACRDGAPMDKLEARTVWTKMAEAAWLCGDPGVQFDTTINEWHTCPETAPINASNPCSEYMFLDDSACNLASFNLMKFRQENGNFDVEAFRHAVAILMLAMEIIVDDSSYPTERIAKNSHDYRPLGLGYANLGALLMADGLPYDSDGGRAATAAITALLGGEAYATSAEIAKAKGPFAGYAKNRDAMVNVMRKHEKASYDVDAAFVPDAFKPVLEAARDSWATAVEIGEKHGFRNAQATVLAPTGTIGFMMDCDTTGIEPDIALIKYKKLVGGGLMKIVNNTVPLALDVLGYDAATKAGILAHLESEETIEGAPGLAAQHLAVFDCAFKPLKGERSIQPMGHVKMMAAAQPFLSGAISKTVNMPESSSVEDIEAIYTEAWKLGLKAIAIYRDNCKRSQPLSSSKSQSDNDGKKNGGRDLQTGPQLPVASFQGMQSVDVDVDALVALLQGQPDKLTAVKQKLGGTRRKLPDERAAITHKFSIGGHEGYITVGLFEDGTPGELFITMSKEGSTISGLMDAFATSTSLSLQYGVPLKVLVDKFSHMRFEPAGFTGNPQIPIAKSLCDYMFRWLGLKFLPAEDKPFDPSMAQTDLFAKKPSDSTPPTPVIEPKALAAAIASSNIAALKKADSRDRAEKRIFQSQADAPSCSSCGSIMIRAGACYKCENCGNTSGCG